MPPCKHTFVKSRRGHVASWTITRSGHDMVYMIGRRISGQPSCGRTQGMSSNSVRGVTKGIMEMMLHKGWLVRFDELCCQRIEASV